jgi:hypothetical protein
MPVLNKLKIPPNIEFSDLYLFKNYKEQIRYNQYVLERVCEANEIHLYTHDIGLNKQTMEVINLWYDQHLEEGGRSEPIAEEILSANKTLLNEGL